MTLSNQDVGQDRAAFSLKMQAKSESSLVQRYRRRQSRASLKVEVKSGLRLLQDIDRDKVASSIGQVKAIRVCIKADKASAMTSHV